MLKVEYLILIDNQNIKCSDNNSFIHLLQSDPDIIISQSQLKHKKLSVKFYIQSGKVKNTGENYFHLSFDCEDVNRIDELVELLKAIKSVLHIINNTPQTLYDGVSLYYSKLAYPLIFHVENLMRKLITKFMLTNVGIDWIKDRVPDDVKTSINGQNKDITFLHNVDFIQLKNFLFSENYPVHKENLIKKLKKAKNINDLSIEEIKTLIPQSNWERFFSEKVDITKDQLNKQWDELYDLRCKIAHNRSFGKQDLKAVENLCHSLKETITKANDNLDKIEVSELERETVAETIGGSFSFAFGEFLSEWRKLESCMITLAGKFEFDPRPYGHRNLFDDAKRLEKNGIIDSQIFAELVSLINVRNAVVHRTEEFGLEEVIVALDRTRELKAKIGSLL